MSGMSSQQKSHTGGGHQPIIWPNSSPPLKMKEIGQRGGRPSCPPLDPPIAYHRAQISDHNSLSDRSPNHIPLALAISNIGGLNTLPCIAMAYAPFQVITDQNTGESLAIADCQCEHDLMVRPLLYIRL